MTVTKLALDFYQQDDVLSIGRQLLGKWLMTRLNGDLTGGMIVETEAYRGPEDRASHAYGGRHTPRNTVMYHEGGCCYVYLCYGIHRLFNVVTNQAGIPHAILIRAIEPLVGTDIMLKRRHKQHLNRSVAGGPGALTEALGIELIHNGISLMSNQIWIEDHDLNIPEADIIASPRIGVSYAGTDASLPWRFRLKNNEWTSPAK